MNIRERSLGLDYGDLKDDTGELSFETDIVGAMDMVGNIHEVEYD